MHFPFKQIFLGIQEKQYTLAQNTSAKSQKTNNPAEWSCECVNPDIILNTYAKVSIGVYITALDCNPLSGVEDFHANYCKASVFCSLYGTIQPLTFK